MTAPLPLGSEAADELTALTREVGWPHLDADWLDFLACGTVWGHRGAQGELLSSAALFDFGTSLASIGLVVVRPAQRGRGLAGELMRLTMARSRAATLALIATPFGIPVYEHLGFRRVDAVTRLIGPVSAPVGPTPGLPAGWSVRAFGAPDLPELLALDRQAVGADRELVLRRLLARALVACCARDRTGAARGYVLALPKQGLNQIGPLVAPDMEVALALIDAVAACVPSPLRIDVPFGHAALRARLVARGLAPKSEDPVMTLHAAPLPGERALIHAIAFQAFG